MEIRSEIGTVMAVIINQTEGIKIKPAIIEEVTMENKIIRGYLFTLNLCLIDGYTHCKYPNKP
tara:strand:- start:19354 stop:19542 length:189 start_codon:yes stop_codon:yes gene_type:complete